MADENGAQTSNLIERLTEAPYKFDFFQAVRRLEAHYRQHPRVGYSRRAVESPLRFGQQPSLAFAPCTVAEFSPGEDGRPARMFINYMGLFGPNGPLPLHITEYAAERMRNHRDPTLARFLDMFHNRTVEMFYRAWACNNPAVSHDRPDQDRFAAYIGSMFGLGMKELLNGDEVPDVAKLHYSGRLSCQTKHPEGLEAILSDYFKTPAQIVEFFGRWMTLPYANQCRMGESPATGLLGISTVVGSRKWDCQQKFRIRLGPMRLIRYKMLLPDKPNYARLDAWVRNYIGFELEWDAQLVLMAEEVPPLQLGAGAQLGWTTWLTSRTPDEDADDLVLQSRAA